MDAFIGIADIEVVCTLDERSSDGHHSNIFAIIALEGIDRDDNGLLPCELYDLFFGFCENGGSESLR